MWGGLFQNDFDIKGVVPVVVSTWYQSRDRTDEAWERMHAEPQSESDPAAGEHVRRDHGRLLLQQQRVGGNVARESRVGEDGLEGGGLARRDAVPG